MKMKLKKILTLVTTITLMIFAQSCLPGLDGDGVIVGSCHFYESSGNGGYCFEYTGENYTTDSIEASCSGAGTFSIDSCTTKDRAYGECILEQDTLNEYKVIIDFDNTAVASEGDAISYCDTNFNTGGVWVGY